MQVWRWWCVGMGVCVVVRVVVGRLYYNPGYPAIPLTPGFTFKTHSVIACAAKCQHQNCLAFNYEDNVCEMYGGDATETTQTISVLHYFGITVSPQLIPVARNKNASATIFWPHPSPNTADLVVDMDLATYYHSHPNHQGKPWWTVDLGGFFLVKSVVVFPKGNAHWRFFQNIEVRAGLVRPAVEDDFSSWSLVGSYTDPTVVSTNITFTYAPGIVARYITVQRMTIASPNYLVLSNVEVLAHPTE